MIKLTLLSRTYCHLCEEMHEDLLGLKPAYDFEVDVVDVDESAALDEKYGDLVPVLLDGELELCHYHLDAAAVERHLASVQGE